MSKLSEQPKEEAPKAKKSGPSWLWVLATLGILLAAWAGYDFYSYRHASTLDDFAKCITAKGFRMYGAWWCPHCAEQKEDFGYAFQYVNYTECGIEGQTHSENEQCRAMGVKNFPTWQLGDGTRQEGVLSLKVLAQRSGCKLP